MGGQAGGAGGQGGWAGRQGEQAGGQGRQAGGRVRRASRGIVFCRAEQAEVQACRPNSCASGDVSLAGQVVGVAPHDPAQARVHQAVLVACSHARNSGSSSGKGAGSSSCGLPVAGWPAASC